MVMVFSRDEIPLHVLISVRKAVKIISIDGDHGYKACNCVPGKWGKGSKCNCYKEGVKCNSRYHEGEENKNYMMKQDKKKKN